MTAWLTQQVKMITMVATLSPSADGRGVGFFLCRKVQHPRLAEIRSSCLPVFNDSQRSSRENQ
jgi:hypothetical protein